MKVPFDVEALIARFEAAATGRGDLTPAFDALAVAAGGTAAILFCPSEGRAGITGSTIAAEVQRAYVESSWRESDLLTVGARNLAEGAVVFTQDLIPVQMVETNRFFTEFLERFDMMWAAGWAFTLEDELWCLGVTRGRAQGPFGEPDRALLEAVAPRISRSLKLLTRSLALYGRGICASLDVRRRPYVTINHLGNVAHISETAEPILADGPLIVRGGRLFSADAETNNRLEQIALCARVGIRGAENLRLSPALEFVAPRVEGRPIIVTAHRTVDGDPYDILPGAQYLLRLMDVSHQPMAREEPIRLLFDLSRREVEIAQRLSCGEDAAAAAKALGLKASYVRQVIKSVLAKTGLNRVHQLIALLSRFPDEA
jgi:DNA-binding CsgD family transcriptional regulator